MTLPSVTSHSAGQVWMGPGGFQPPTTPLTKRLLYAVELRPRSNSLLLSLKRNVVVRNDPSSGYLLISHAVRYWRDRWRCLTDPFPLRWSIGIIFVSVPYCPILNKSL